MSRSVRFRMILDNKAMRDLKLDQELVLLQSLMGEAKAFRDIVQATLSTEVVVPEHDKRLEALRESLPELSRQFQEKVGLEEDDSVDRLFSGVKDLPISDPAYTA